MTGPYDAQTAPELHAREAGLAGARIAIVTLGTRGDHQPFLLLARELRARGAQVTFLANPDYPKLAEAFAIDVVPAAETPFETLLATEEIDRLFDQHAGTLANLRHARPFLRVLRRHLADMIERCGTILREQDLVVYNPMAFYAGDLARELGKPAVRVMCQPLLPSRREPLSLLGRASLGRLGNRLSYQLFRGLTLFALGSSGRRRANRPGRLLRPGMNPLTSSLHHSTQLLAYSTALAPPPGDWPLAPVRSGFWFDAPEPGGTLAPELEAFLAAGPPPISVGLGSMLVRARRNTDLVLRALSEWGGRAVLVKGPGLALPDALPANLFAASGVAHDLLFPRVAAVVTHGGAGTVAAALRHGKPQVVLPVLGDQFFWGRKVAEAGAAEMPIAIGRITPAELAARIGRVGASPHLRQAALDMRTRLLAEPGLRGAVEAIAGCLPRHEGQRG